MRKLLTSFLMLLWLLSIASWVGLSIWSYSTTSKITPTDVQGFNDNNSAYLNVGLAIPLYDPKVGSITIAITCGLAPNVQNALKQAIGLTDSHEYDLSLNINPVQFNTGKSISFQYPPQSGSSVSIAIIAHGSENVIAEAAQLANSYQVDNQTEIKWTDRTFLAPLDSYKVRLSFQMAVPPGVEIPDTAISSGGGYLMPCKFYETHVDGNYHCTVKAVSNNEIELQFNRDSHYIWFLILPFLFIVISGILVVIGRTSKVRNYYFGVFAILLTFSSWGLTRSLAVPGATAPVTLYDVVVLVSCVIALFVTLPFWGDLVRDLKDTWTGVKS